MKDPIPAIFKDFEEIKQVLYNLNEYMQSNGSIFEPIISFCTKPLDKIL